MRKILLFTMFSMVSTTHAGYVANFGKGITAYFTDVKCERSTEANEFYETIPINRAKVGDQTGADGRPITVKGCYIEKDGHLLGTLHHTRTGKNEEIDWLVTDEYHPYEISKENKTTVATQPYKKQDKAPEIQHTSDVCSQPIPIISSVDIHAEYVSDWLTTDAKYEGRRITIRGTVIWVTPEFSMNNEGVGHHRGVKLNSYSEDPIDQSRTDYCGVFLHFTEASHFGRRPTVTDAVFRNIKRGNTLNAICTMEPVDMKPECVVINLSKCSIP